MSEAISHWLLLKLITLFSQIQLKRMEPTLQWHVTSRLARAPRRGRTSAASCCPSPPNLKSSPPKIFRRRCSASKWDWCTNEPWNWAGKTGQISSERSFSLSRILAGKQRLTAFRWRQSLCQKAKRVLVCHDESYLIRTSRYVE